MLCARMSTLRARRRGDGRGCGFWAASATSRLNVQQCILRSALRPTSSERLIWSVWGPSSFCVDATYTGRRNGGKRECMHPARGVAGTPDD
ncbi:hypothetical protein FA95DRAFT_446260 [Auriscalpium vulgare]|uniref:Uncharacterized protein n=1 Tax=Auriscalpium vulgare TaxID=40419 RepID=A0ACB8RG83_9AGAM|nr:hypothetical protein FA95DRAFT_446260 [Auriscalpium vulgare]